MMKNIVFCLSATIALLFFSGCGGRSPQPRFYTLTSISDAQNWQTDQDLHRKVTIGIGPVKLADYLNQNRIITRIDNNIKQAEYDQWSGSLKSNLSNVLAENIGYKLQTDSVFLFPWRSSVPIDYQLTVDIIRFDGQLGGEVVLVARWNLIRGEEKEFIAIKRSEIRVKTDNQSYDAFVKGQSQALGKLSSEIKTAIENVQN
jgi:uncharacterized lipoprotein YmbA